MNKAKHNNDTWVCSFIGYVRLLLRKQITSEESFAGLVLLLLERYEWLGLVLGQPQGLQLPQLADRVGQQAQVVGAEVEHAQFADARDLLGQIEQTVGAQ